MNKLLSFSITVLFFLTVTPMTLNSAANISLGSSSLQLNGIAIQTELRSDWFINALYLPAKNTSSESILSDLSPKRMEIKVLADNLSARRLKRFWVERIRNNNEPEIVLGMAKQVREFAKVMGQNLQANDVVSIDYLPGDATKISINGSVNANLSPKLFNMVLKSWIGDRPPSKEFKAAILGQSNFDTLLSRYSAIQPSEARIALFDKQAQAEIAKLAKAEADKKQAEELKIAQEKAVQEAKQQQVLLDAQKKIDDERQAQLALAAQASKREQERLKLLEEARLAKEEASKPPVVEIPAGPTPEEIATIKNNYNRAIKRHYAPYFKYPTRELLKRYGTSVFNRPKKGKTHGNVSISIEVDRDGDLVGGSLSSSSGEKLLDDSVLKAMFDAVPFPTMPSELEGETFNTVLSINIPTPQT